MPATKLRTKLSAVGLVWDEFFKAGVDLSGSNAYRFMQPGSVFGEVVPATGVAACGIIPIGVSQNNPTAGGLVRVRVMGKTTIAACLTACNLQPGTWVTVGSYAGASPTGGSGLAFARWAGSAVPSASASTWLGYGEIYLVGPSFSTCVSSPC